MLPSIQIIIHFLNFLDLRCRGPRMMTPMMPLSTGEPPTTDTAVALTPNQGYKKKARTIDRALKTPK